LETTEAIKSLLKQENIMFNIEIENTAPSTFRKTTSWSIGSKSN